MAVLIKELTIGDEQVEREYFIAWQSLRSAAKGSDARMLTYDEAIDLAKDLNEKIPNCHHFVAKRLKPKGALSKETLPQGTYLPKPGMRPKTKAVTPVILDDMSAYETLTM